jgi:DNA segregation ATPase FtsK/SpoIIIE, S-DNA-T family
MSQELVHRQRRRSGPPVGSGELTVATPPLAAGAGAVAWWTYLFPVLGSVGALVFVLINPQPLYLVAGGMFLTGSLAMGVGMYVQQRSAQRRRLQHDRDAYLAYLRQIRDRARETAAEQRKAAAWRHPAPDRLLPVATNPTRVWERWPTDPDFLEVRVGVSALPLATPLRVDAGANPMAEIDPIAAQAAERLLSRQSTVADLPMCIQLRDAGVVSIVGPQPLRDSLARALVCQLATFQSPDDVRLVIAAGPDRRAAWQWLKWIPHTRLPSVDHDGPTLLALDVDQLRALLEGEVESRRTEQLRRHGPAPAEMLGLGISGAANAFSEQDALPPRAHVVLVIDGLPAAPAMAAIGGSPGAIGVTALHLLGSQMSEPRAVDIRLRLQAGGTLALERPGAEVSTGRADQLGPRAAEVLARALAPLRLSPTSGSRRLVETVGLPELLGLEDPAGLNPELTWRPRPLHDRLRVPLGIDPDGEPVILDLKEPALDGMGPHGLIVGATGSGKSELLRTLVTGLAITHPPELLSLVLVDFKGGATFAGMADLPHVAGVITNLQGDLALVDRMRDALYGEQLRRQELLRRSGNLDSLREYHDRRAAGVDLEPLPFLLVIVDEFGELLASRPDFVDLFVAVGRVGRSLGMHLVLASQRLDEGRLRGLESHLSYRIALRVFSAMESRTVLGVPDAYTLPPVPGSAYLKVDAAAPRRFKVASASAPCLPQSSPASVAAVRLFEAWPAANAPAPPLTVPQPAATAAGPSTVTLAVERLRTAAPRAHQVWLPPLEPSLTLDKVLPPLRMSGKRGLVVDWPEAGLLRVPLGIVDRPAEQAMEILAADMSGAAGHLAVVGAPQTGKSTLLRALVVACALTHTPVDVQFYGIDFGGGGLHALEKLPHVGSICGRFDPERLRRVVSEITALLDRREKLFRVRGIDSVRSFRALRAAGQLRDETLGDVFLLIDNWAAVRQDYEDLEQAILDLAARGLGYGVHLVITANRWLEVRSNLRDNIAGRLELRLNEPADSEIDRRMAANVPAGVPGRGLTTERLMFQAALPRMDGLATPEDGSSVQDNLVARIAEAWDGPVAPSVRVLPRHLPATELPLPEPVYEQGVAIGVAEPDLAPAYLDLLSGDPHFLVFGDGESGKTNLLRTYLCGLTRQTSPEGLAIVVLDYRRTLLDVVPASFLSAYAGALPAAMDAVAQLRELLLTRLPGPNLPAAVLRRRSWWSGPEVLLVVDDYDLVVTPSASPLLPIADFLAQGRDLGFHVLVARRAGGAARAVFEPVLQRLKELGTPGLLLSGDRQEGPLLGPYPPMPQPPGRGLLVARRQAPVLLQVAWTPPPESPGDC